MPLFKKKPSVAEAIQWDGTRPVEDLILTLIGAVGADRAFGLQRLMGQRLTVGHWVVKDLSTGRCQVMTNDDFVAEWEPN